MSQLRSIAKKELRAYFVSPLALIFLGVFLTAVFVSFFFGPDSFFKRNLADIRPLFEWLPLTLIVLVAPLTMGLWSDEQRLGTIEVLMTLPVKTRDLVLGKFFAGLGLVAIALALTLGIPITVAMLGHLDWGPVFGGYIAALLLAAAYLSIGLFISATTRYAFASLLITALVSVVWSLIGAEWVTGRFGYATAEVLRAIGTSSRFNSIQRGVLDLSDLMFYGSICVGFLFLNVVVLEAKKWSSGRRTRPQRSALKIAAGLVLANLLVLNVWLGAMHRGRIDMTAQNMFSISPVTKKLLGSLDAPLLIRGYFSKETHKKLSALVPQIRDTLKEYGKLGGDKIRVEFVDPEADKDMEKEANEAYNIKTFPFRLDDRHKFGVVNAYFHILVKYGDKFEVLTFQDLIDFLPTGDDVQVKLRNLEYDLSRTVKKVVYEFKPIEEVFAKVPGKLTLTAYVTPKTLPEEFKKSSATVEKVIKDFVDRSGGKLVFTSVDPSGDDKDALRQKLFKQHRIKPMAIGLFSREIFYNYLVLESDKKSEVLRPDPETAEPELKNAVTAALKRMVPGFIKTVGLCLPEAKQPPMNPMMQRMRQPQGPQYNLVRRQLEQNYQIQTVDLKKGVVPADIDILMVIAPENLDGKQQYAIDQFLMRGGSVVIATGRYSLDTESFGGQGLAVKKLDSKLDELLEAWGVKVEEKLVLDPQNEAFPIPVTRDLGGLKVQQFRMLDYPFWVDVRNQGMGDGNPIVAGLPSLTMQWASPLTLKERKGIKYDRLLSSSKGSWTQDTTDIQPDMGKFPGKGFGHDDKTETKPQLLGVAAQGVFESAFKGKPSPLMKESKPGEAAKPGEKAAVDGGRTVEQSPATARLVVFASSDFLRDEVLGLAQQSGSRAFQNSLNLAQNVADWSVADVDLLSIRSRGAFARTLDKLEDAAMLKWEIINGVLMVVALFGVIFTGAMRRRRLKPMVLVPAKRNAAES